MTFSHSTIVELEREATRLRRMRDALDAALRGIGDVLLLARAGDHAQRPRATAQRKTARPAKMSFASNGKRGALGSALRLLIQQKPGMRSSQLVEILREGRFAVNGKTELPDRVRQELRRLVRRGVLTRAADGAYTCKVQ